MSTASNRLHARTSTEKVASWETYRRLWPYIRPYGRSLALVFLVSLVSTSLSLIQPYISKLLIDRALLLSDARALFWIAGLMLATTVLSLVLNIVYRYRYSIASAEMLFDIRIALFRHLQTLSPRFYAQFRMGDLVSRLNGDVSEVQRVSADSILSSFGNVIFFVGCVGLMCWLDWRLFVVGVVLVPACLASFVHYQKKLTAITKDLRERSADLGSFIVDTLLGMRVVVSLSGADQEAARFRRLNDGFVKTMLRMQTTSFMTAALPSTILTGATTTVLLYGGWRVVEGQMTIGALVAFMAYHARVLSPLQALMGMSSGLASARVSLARIFELFDTPPEVVEIEHPHALKAVKGSIRLEGVSVRYDREPVLTDVNLVIPHGSFCSILGPSGVGKSTLADLIVRHMDPDQGMILVDGQDIRSLSLRDLRREIILVDQAPYIFNGTIEANITFALDDISSIEVEAAARAAGLQELLARLPEGLKTRTGERGLALSVGERQRVALARALLRRPSVLILDEPTSALDAETEQLVTSGLRATLPDATIVVITHRPTIAALSDLTITIDHGGAKMSSSRKVLSVAE